MPRKNRSGASQATVSTEVALSEDRLVVVRMQDGRVIKGRLRWHSEPEGAIALPHLPAVLDIRHDGAPVSSIRVADSMAVFFVRTHHGESAYEEVRFFAGDLPSELWVQVRLASGELLEGSTVNNLSLITGPGLWLWPSDKCCNNMLIYVPWTAATEFHVFATGKSFPPDRAERSPQKQ